MRPPAVGLLAVGELQARATLLDSENSRKRIETSQQISEQKRDYSKSKKMFSEITELVRKGKPVNRGICDSSVDGVHAGRKFTLSRGDDGKDYVQFHN